MRIAEYLELPICRALQTFLSGPGSKYIVQAPKAKTLIKHIIQAQLRENSGPTGGRPLLLGLYSLAEAEKVSSEKERVMIGQTGRWKWSEAQGASL